MVLGVTISKPEASPEDPSQEPSSLLLAPSVFPPLYPGNIEVFKDMQIKELNLYNCYNLVGECTVSMGQQEMVVGLRYTTRMRLQGLT